MLNEAAQSSFQATHRTKTKQALKTHTKRGGFLVRCVFPSFFPAGYETLFLRAGRTFNATPPHCYNSLTIMPNAHTSEHTKHLQDGFHMCCWASTKDILFLRSTHTQTQEYHLQDTTDVVLLCCTELRECKTNTTRTRHSGQRQTHTQNIITLRAGARLKTKTENDGENTCCCCCGRCLPVCFFLLLAFSQHGTQHQMRWCDRCKTVAKCTLSQH